MIFPFNEPCPGNRFVIRMLRSELLSFEYSLSDLYCFGRFAFLSAIVLSGFVLKAAGGRFCLDEM